MQKQTRNKRIHTWVLIGIMVFGWGVTLWWVQAANNHEKEYKLTSDHRIKQYEEIPILVSGEIEED